MAAYDYKCTACDDRFEVTRSISDKSEVACPSCGAPGKRVFTALGVHFKGTGFHNTDYKKSDAPTSESKSEAPACSSASST